MSVTSTEPRNSPFILFVLFTVCCYIVIHFYNERVAPKHVFYESIANKEISLSATPVAQMTIDSFTVLCIGDTYPTCDLVILYPKGYRCVPDPKRVISVTGVVGVFHGIPCIKVTEPCE